MLNRIKNLIGRQKKQKIILHIGRHKSGTTALQEYLSRHADFLNEHGFDYLGIFRREDAHHLLSEPLNRRRTDAMDERELEALVDGAREKILEATDPEKTLIISSEAFQNCDPAVVRRLFPEKTFDVKLVCYFRDQVSYILSSYAQAIHAEYRTDDFDRYIRAFDGNYHTFARAWGRLFPKRVFRVFSRSDLINGDIVDDFCINVLGTNPVTAEPLESNPSLSRRYLSFKLMYNRRYNNGKLEKKIPLGKLYSLLGELSRTDPLGKLRMNRAQREYVMEKYAEPNRRFFAEYIPGKRFAYEKADERYGHYRMPEAEFELILRKIDEAPWPLRGRTLNHSELLYGAGVTLLGVSTPEATTDVIERPDNLEEDVPALGFVFKTIGNASRPVELFRVDDTVLCWTFKDGSMLYDEKGGERFDRGDHNAEKPAFTEPSGETLEGKTLLLTKFRRARNNYAHFILERLPVLFYFEAVAQIRDFDYYIVDEGSMGFFRQMAEILGLKGTPVPAGRNGSLSVRHLYCASTLPHPLNKGDRLPVERYRNLLPGTGGTVPAAERIFIDRPSGRRGVANGEALDRVLQKYGIRKVSFDGMAIADQIRTINRASLVTGVHGAAFANLVFADASKKRCCIEVLPKRYGMQSFWILSRALGMGYCAVPPAGGWDAKRTPGTHREDVEVDLDMFENAVVKALGYLAGGEGAAEISDGFPTGRVAKE